jgi:hypothetical protein
MLELKVNQKLNKDQIREIAPSVFTSVPSKEVSKHYVHIPTEVVIDDMEKLGWDVMDVKEVKARKENTRGFQKHLLVFRNEDIVIDGEDGDRVFPQILLTNSHDAKNAFTFTAGLFRMVCENGLVISTKEFGSVRVRHMGYDFKTLQVQINDICEQLPLTVESMNKMKNTEMEESKAVEFATKALETRFTDDELKRIEIDIKDILFPTRDEDMGNDLWSIFNVVQEKMIDGGFNYTVGNKIRKAREIKNFRQDIKVNEKLFSLALDYVV